jgi:hypothetical protein
VKDLRTRISMQLVYKERTEQADIMIRPRYQVRISDGLPTMLRFCVVFLSLSRRMLRQCLAVGRYGSPFPYITSAIETDLLNTLKIGQSKKKNSNRVLVSSKK